MARHQSPHNRLLAWRLQNILVECGLSQADYSIGGRRVVRVPQVVSVVAGPPVGLYIHILSGQTPDDFAAQASAIAHGLGVAKVRVVRLAPSLVRLELLPASFELGGDVTYTAGKTRPQGDWSFRSYP